MTLIVGGILALVLGSYVFAKSGPRTEDQVAIRQASDTPTEEAADRSGEARMEVLRGAHTPGRYRYFERPDPYDPWSFPITRWQARSRQRPSAVHRTALAAGWGVAAPRAPILAEAGTDLLSRYRDFVAERKRTMAFEVATWLQTEGRRHFISDSGGDYWLTLDEVLARAGDDCDGLELLAYSLLRGMGFDVYRAIVVRTGDRQHHMVTLWFETPEEPRVIDPTGAMTMGAPRMSEVAGWIPLRIFSETEQFAVQSPSERDR